MKTKELKVGSILSETSFFTVIGIEGSDIKVKDDNGNSLSISESYVDKVLDSADLYDAEEERNMTSLAELFIASKNVAMTVAFYKKDQVKGVRAFKAEKEAKIKEIQEARVSDVPGLLNALIENPLSKVIPGELRVMKGRHYGFVDELGRVHFIDMEVEKEILKTREGVEYDSRKREVDPRTIQYLIVEGVKYNLKK